MKKIFYILLSIVLLASCGKDDPYVETTKDISVELIFPEGISNEIKQGIEVKMEETTSGNTYKALTDNTGIAKFKIPLGMYRISASLNLGSDGNNKTFNGVKENVHISSSLVDAIVLQMISAESSAIIIKEIYTGGCTQEPISNKAYQFDKYVILYNNSSVTAYLDELCFATVAPANAESVGSHPVWVNPDKIHLDEGAWQFGGDGTKFPLAPGEQAVLSVTGAIDHKALFPESVNLNKADYFVCYEPTAFPNVKYHPVPGTNIKEERHMILLNKTGLSNAYVTSGPSPAVVIFKVPKSEDTAKEYTNNPENIEVNPNSAQRKHILLPKEWVVDGMEVFYGKPGVGTSKKRLPDVVDAGYVVQEETKKRYTLYRNVDLAATKAIDGNEAKLVYDYTLGNDPSMVDAEASIKNGARIVYMDTNNSSNDFHQRKIQSLNFE